MRCRRPARADSCWSSRRRADGRRGCSRPRRRCRAGCRCDRSRCRTASGTRRARARSALPRGGRISVEQPGGEQTSLQESSEEAREVGRRRDDRPRGPPPRRARRAAVASGCQAADDAVVLARRVAVRVAAGNIRPCREAGVCELERREDPAAQLALDGRPGSPLDDEAEEDVVGARVREALAGPSDRPLAERQRQPARGASTGGAARSPSGAGTPSLPRSRRARMCARATAAP